LLIATCARYVLKVAGPAKMVERRDTVRVASAVDIDYLLVTANAWDKPAGPASILPSEVTMCIGS
jgi:hypothetical protein